MPVQFAGSKSLDDRRRRRIAQEALLETSRKSTSTRGAKGQAEPDPAEDRPVLPDESIIPRAPWKIAALGILGAVLWGATLWMGIAEWPRRHGLAEIAALVDGTLPKLLTTAALLLAAQLSHLILWYRSRARKDFQGRYRIWACSAIFWSLTCLCVTTGLHLPLARLVYEQYPLDCWRPELTFWLAPFAVGVLALYRLLGKEMAHCRASSRCWHLAFVLALAVGGLRLGGDLLIDEPIRRQVTAAVNTFWHGLITLTFLIHARFVVHVTNEAGPRVPPLPVRLVRSLWSLLSRRGGPRADAPRTELKRKAATETPAKKKPVPARKAVGDEEPAAKPVKKRVLGKNVRIDAPSETPAAHVTIEKPAPAPQREPAPAAKPAPVPAPKSPPAAVAKSQPAPPSKAPAPVPVAKQPPAAPQMTAPNAPETDGDADDEEDWDRPLSKKERKRLKKLQRSS